MIAPLSDGYLAEFRKNLELSPLRGGSFIETVDLITDELIAARVAIAAYEAEQTTPDLDEQIRGAAVDLADRLTECGPVRDSAWSAACRCGWVSDEYTYRAHLTGLIELSFAAHLKGETR